VRRNGNVAVATTVECSQAARAQESTAEERKMDKDRPSPRTLVTGVVFRAVAPPERNRSVVRISHRKSRVPAGQVLHCVESD
jgi:hypothetical protein